MSQETRAVCAGSVSFILVFVLVALQLACAQETGGFGMGPPTTPEIVAGATAAGTPVAEGPFEPTWESIENNYKVPQWFRDGKFGIFMHWGLYAVPAHHNEWYQKHMYGNRGIQQWHVDNFGPVDQFGYKDFIPLFKCEKYDPDAWAELFKKAGAAYVIPTAEHHDGFSLWDSDLNKYCATKMGPMRDLIGDLAEAVRKRGMKFGVSNHSIEHFTFINPIEAVETDLYDPQWADFYAVADRSPEACRRFLEMWVAKNIELIDKYQVDMLWFDNGVNHRMYDPLKLKVAAYYYNRARQWGKEVSISTKDASYLAGSILDFEKAARGPADIRPGCWQIDDLTSDRSWGYTSTLKFRKPGSVIGELIDTVSKGGALLLNISPRADGTIPQEQQNLLLEVGKWLDINGEAVYGTRPWIRYGEGPSVAAQTFMPQERRAPRPANGRQEYRFTCKGPTLYAIALRWPGEQAVITALGQGQPGYSVVDSVTLLGHKGTLRFTQDYGGLKVQLPTERPCEHAFVLKINDIVQP